MKLISSTGAIQWSTRIICTVCKAVLEVDFDDLFRLYMGDAGEEMPIVARCLCCGCTSPIPHVPKHFAIDQRESEESRKRIRQ